MTSKTFNDPIAKQDLKMERKMRFWRWIWKRCGINFFPLKLISRLAKSRMEKIDRTYFRSRVNQLCAELDIARITSSPEPDKCLFIFNALKRNGGVINEETPSSVLAFLA